MRICRIFSPTPIHLNEPLQLAAQTAHYVSKVLRLKMGNELCIFDGRGGEYQAHITELEKRAVCVLPTSHSSNNLEPPLKINLGIGMSRGDRMDYVIQKATELGVHQITPLHTERVELKLKADKIEKRVQHWQGIAVSACEQSGYNLVPTISSPTPLPTWAEQETSTLQLVLNPLASHSLTAFSLAHLKSNTTHNASISLAVGPEGGFSDNDISALTAAGFQGVTVGPRILRTETAPVAAIAILQSLFGDLI